MGTFALVIAAATVATLLSAPARATEPIASEDARALFEGISEELASGAIGGYVVEFDAFDAPDDARTIYGEVFDTDLAPDRAIAVIVTAKDGCNGPRLIGIPSESTFTTSGGTCGQATCCPCLYASVTYGNTTLRNIKWTRDYGKFGCDSGGPGDTCSGTCPNGSQTLKQDVCLQCIGGQYRTVDPSNCGFSD